MKYRGVAYYPEAWPMERWDEDIKLMREAGINMVRMGEFAWARLEPREGQYALDWYLDIVDRMGQAGISVLAATPTATPPAWLWKKYPDAIRMDQGRRRAAHGNRRHNCPTSETYLEKARTIASVLGRALKDSPAIVAWQIDNEVAPGELDEKTKLFCQCDSCAEKFRQWLKDKYGSIAALNDAWGNVFWSADYNEWDQIDPPAEIPPRHMSWHLDYARFQSQTWGHYIRNQAEVLRAINSDWTLTTNCWLGMSAPISALDIFDSLDVVANDPTMKAYDVLEIYQTMWDMYRNIKRPRRPFWVTETTVWQDENTRPDLLPALRTYTYNMFAHGADSISYFRWRQSPMGEEDHPEIQDWSGVPGRAYEQIKAQCTELEELADRLGDLPAPEAKVAMLYDFDMTIYDASYRRWDHTRHIINTHDEFVGLNVATDVLPLKEGLDLSPYRLVVLTYLKFAPDWFAEEIARFVRAGGVVLAQPQLANLDPAGKYHTVAIPAGLTETFGLVVRERWPILDEKHASQGPSPTLGAPDEPKVSLQINLPIGAMQTDGVEFMEMLETRGAKTIGTYTSGSLIDTPAITENCFGDGLAIYQACWLEKPATSAVLEYALDRAELEPGPVTPERVQIRKRGRVRFYLNHSAEQVSIPRIAPGEVLVGTVDGVNVQLAPFDVCLIEEETI